ncbi:MAG: hypothetical protein Q8K20_11180 [Gemmobacter sp.]|nr:hypothetical protein [Gemmobacter sp.]
MARPKKDEADVRRRWSVLNASPREREAIEAYARASGLSVSSYILRRALQAPVSPRQDWHLIVRQQAQLLRQLDEIAAALVTSGPARDAGAALLSLRRIEAQIATWGAGAQLVIDTDDEGGF